MSSHSNSQTASDPSRNITVSASAGTGKTYLLVSRIIRLLINGANPNNILALTFTRKAAGEMRERLQQQLSQLALADDTALQQRLTALGVEPNEENRRSTRRIYEIILFAHQPIRISTFHAFCQELTCANNRMSVR